MSQYQEMIDEPFQEPATIESFEKVMFESVPINLQMRKKFQNF